MRTKSVNKLRPAADKLIIYRGNHVVIGGRGGWIASDEEGYFLQQTRFLSRFKLQVEGGLTSACCNIVESHSFVGYYLTPSPAGRVGGPPGDEDSSGGEIVEKGIEIQINAYVGGGCHYDIHVTNHALAAATVSLDWQFAADFADLDEVRSGKSRQEAPVERSYEATGPGKGELKFVYQHPKIDHATRIRVAAPGSLEDGGDRLRTTLTLQPRRPALISIDLAPVFLGAPMEPWFGLDGEPTEQDEFEERVEKWLASCAGLETSNQTVQTAWDRAATDLWSLQALRGDGVECFTPIAGIPRYTALFGRDTLAAGIQSSFLNPLTLEGALRSIGRWTARQVDDRFDAQPGKVLHQRQLSPLALLGETPLLHYYGDYSAPGLYIIGAALHFSKTGDKSAFAAIRDKVFATLEWMDRYGDLDDDGLYEYRTLAGKAGIKNQGWKDSSQAILYPDGSYVHNPIAVCEVQGLNYAAKLSLAGMLLALGESDRSAGLYAEAAALKKRFNERFWLPSEKFFALALDPDKRPVKTIASNPGACLAYGIIDSEKAQAVAERMLEPDMFSGWGVRTLSSDHPAYNPLAYHLGSVWPVSNANICYGLKRYGFDAAFHKVAKAIFDASAIFDYDRLPEVYGGHPRDARHRHPGVYPGACSPQAWSASAIIQICHAMTGLLPVAPFNALIIDPSLPDWMPDLLVSNLEVGGKRISVSFHRETNGFTNHEIVQGGEGLRIYRPEPASALPIGTDRIARAMNAISS